MSTRCGEKGGSGKVRAAEKTIGVCVFMVGLGMAGISDAVTVTNSMDEEAAFFRAVVE